MAASHVGYQQIFITRVYVCFYNNSCTILHSYSLFQSHCKVYVYHSLPAAPGVPTLICNKASASIQVLPSPYGGIPTSYTIIIDAGSAQNYVPFATGELNIPLNLKSKTDVTVSAINCAGSSSISQTCKSLHVIWVCLSTVCCWQSNICCLFNDYTNGTKKHVEGDQCAFIKQTRSIS